MGEHAKLGPSAAARWTRCHGALALEDKLPDKPSRFAAEGSVAHLVASDFLEGKAHPTDRVGEVVTYDGFTIEIDAVMAGHAVDYANLVLEYKGDDGELMVERKVDLSPVLGIPDQFGTSDAIIVRGRQLIVIDLKYGMGVKVDASQTLDLTVPDGTGGVLTTAGTFPNEQAALYGLGALEEVSLFADIDEVVLVIHQPRLNHVSEFNITAAQLRVLGAVYAQHAAKAFDCLVGLADPEDHLVPGDKQCRFCRARPTCPALRGVVDETVIDDFDDLILRSNTEPDVLADAMDRVDMIEHWCKSIRAEVERRLLAGQPVRGYKIVRGKQGNRAWTSEAEAEAKLKSFRLKQDEMYTRSLISPTSAEKLLKKSDPKRWEKLQAVIQRSEGKLSVAPASDPRPAEDITPVADDFAGLIEE